MPLVSAKVVILVVSIMMSREVPDVDHAARMGSFDECWSAAKEFTERDLTDSMRGGGAIGLKATCAYREMPSEQN